MFLKEVVFRLFTTRCFSNIDAILGLSTKKAFRIIYDIMKGTKPVILAIIAALVLKLFFFDFIIAQGHSMEPAIKDGSVLVVSRVAYGLQLPTNRYLFRWGKPKIGEVVVFYTPSGEIAVKRCTIVEKDGLFYAEGDNSLASYDSRSYGFVLADKIIGKVLGY
jgi:signal peptidase I